MTYNIRACLGLDSRRDVERVADVIESQAPDVVALQEVDVCRRRSGSVDQVEALAGRLNMSGLAGVSFRDADGGGYGNAVLSRLPARCVRHARVPHLPAGEPRSAMWVRVAHDGGAIDVVTAHLSFRRADRPVQIDALLGPAWLGHPDMGGHVVLAGDLNCGPRSRGFRMLAAGLDDAQQIAGGRPRATWPTRRPFRRLDHILVSRSLEVMRGFVARSPRARLASDHYPVVADVAPLTAP